MFAVEKKRKRINDKIVETFERTVKDHGTELEVEAGTTGYKGTPCRKAGGRTYLRLLCWEGDFHFEPIFTEDGKECFGIEIACCGDAALDAIMKALIFTGDVLTDQRCEIDD